MVEKMESLMRGQSGRPEGRRSIPLVVGMRRTEHRGQRLDVKLHNTDMRVTGNERENDLFKQ